MGRIARECAGDPKKIPEDQDVDELELDIEEIPEYMEFVDELDELNPR